MALSERDVNAVANGRYYRHLGKRSLLSLAIVAVAILAIGFGFRGSDMAIAQIIGFVVVTALWAFWYVRQVAKGGRFIKAFVESWKQTGEIPDDEEEDAKQVAP